MSWIPEQACIWKVSKSRTTVVAANGEVQTEEEATVYVKDLDLFVTVMLLEDAPAVLSLGKPNIMGITTIGPVVRNHNSSIDRLFKLSYTNISDIFIAGSGNSYTASRINKK